LPTNYQPKTEQGSQNLSSVQGYFATEEAELRGIEE